jgi:hypothetical protein
MATAPTKSYVQANRRLLADDVAPSNLCPRCKAEMDRRISRASAVE